jgi:serine/threonine-protein kinase
VSRVCRALDYAHRFVDPSGRRLDIIHCDVSPGNVLATWDGHIKLADFGIARATFSAGLATQEGAREGKQQYMSPEQCMGDDLSARTDVYSLGVMLFELLALDHLGVVERSAASAEGPTLQPLPEFGHLLHGLDATMEYIVRRALEQDPRRRASAAMLGADLDRWITTQHTYGSPDRLQSHLSQLFPHDFTSAVWAEHPGGEAGFTALERAVRHNANGRAGLLERWFGQ